MSNPLYDNEYIPAVGDRFHAFTRQGDHRHRAGPFVCSYEGLRSGRRCVEANHGDHRLWLDIWWFEKVQDGIQRRKDSP